MADENENPRITPLGLCTYLLEQTTFLRPAFVADPSLAVFLAMTSWCITGCKIDFSKTVRVREQILSADEFQNAEGTATFEGWAEHNVYGLWGMDRGLHPMQLIQGGVQPIEAQAQVALQHAYYLKKIQDWNQWGSVPCGKAAIALEVHDRRGANYGLVSDEINEKLAPAQNIFTVGRIGPVYQGHGQGNKTLHVAARELAIFTDLAAGFVSGWYYPELYKLVYRPEIFLPVNNLEQAGVLVGRGSFLDRAFMLRRRLSFAKPDVTDLNMSAIAKHYEQIVGAFSSDPNGWSALLTKHKIMGKLTPPGGIPGHGSGKNFFERAKEAFGFGDESDSFMAGLPLWARVGIILGALTGTYYFAKALGTKKGGKK